MFHPLFMTQTFNLLRGSCQHCHHFLMPGALVVQYTARLLLLEHGLVAESDELELVTLHASKPAPAPKAGKGGATEDVGESTGESVPEYKARVWRVMTNMIKRARAGTPTRAPLRSTGGKRSLQSSSRAQTARNAQTAGRESGLARLSPSLEERGEAKEGTQPDDACVSA